MRVLQRAYGERGATCAPGSPSAHGCCYSAASAAPGAGGTSAGAAVSSPPSPISSSNCAWLRGSITCRTSASGSPARVVPFGSVEVLGEHLGADLRALDVHVDAVGEVGGLRLDGKLNHLLVENAAGEHLAGHPDRDFNRDLLAAADLDEVDVLDHALDRVPLHRLRQRERGPAGQALDPDQRVRASSARA